MKDSNHSSKTIPFSCAFLILIHLLSPSPTNADPEATVSISNPYRMSAGNKPHATTRGTVDLVHRYQGMWFIFHAASINGPHEGFQTSPDGITWSDLKSGANRSYAENGRGFLVEGSRIYTTYKTDIDPDPDINDQEMYFSEGTISRTNIHWGNRQLLFHSTGDLWWYYPDIQKDGTGRFHLTSRHEGSHSIDIFWVRSVNPNDITSWSPPTILLQGNATEEPDAHENIQLPGDQVYVIARTRTKDVYVPGHPAGFYGIHYDGTNWESSPTKLGVSDGIGGSDRRMSAIFDPIGKRIHLLYIDNHLNLYHKTLSAPYNSSEWTPPSLIATNVFTVTAGIDTSSSPSRLAIVFGDQLTTDGGRWHTGQLYLKWFHGSSWDHSNLLISEPGTIHNWYPNMIRDVSGEVGVMYLKGQGNAPFTEVMFSLIQYSDSLGDRGSDREP